MMASGAYFYVGVQPQNRASLPCFVGSQGLSSGLERFFKQSLEPKFSATQLTANPVLGNSAGMKRGPEWLCSGLIPSLFIISQARCNVVVAPGRILRINGLILAMLFCLLLGVVVPRVGALIR